MVHGSLAPFLSSAGDAHPPATQDDALPDDLWRRAWTAQETLIRQRGLDDATEAWVARGIAARAGYARRARAAAEAALLKA